MPGHNAACFLPNPLSVERKNNLKFDDRHRRVIEQLLLCGRLSWKELQKRAQLRRSDDHPRRGEIAERLSPDDEFGLIMGDLSEAKLIDCWPTNETRYYRIKPLVRAEAEAKILLETVKAS